MNYSLYLSTKKTNSSGLTPIYAHVGPDKKERSSKVWVEEIYYDRTYKRVKPEHPLAKELNEKLTQFEALLSKCKTLSEFDDACNPVSLEEQKSPTLIECLWHLYEVIAEDKTLAKCTLDSYKNRCKNIESWLHSIEKTHIRIVHFDKYYAEKFYMYMIQKGDSVAHIANHLKFIRRAVTYASEVFGTRKTSVYSFKVKSDKKAQIYLRPEEVNRIKNKVIYNTSLRKVRDLFLMQCYTGFSYIDLMRFTEVLIEQHNGILFIKYTRKKTGNTGLLPVLPEAGTIISKYGGQLPRMSNQSYNRLLKELAGLCEIELNLTTHVGRKTFGSLMLNRGASMETTTKMLGKTNVRETEKIYAEIHHTRIISELPMLRQASLF